ncbi:hypothetical protein [Pseudomonas abietaniphila]|uniref:Uncharacterized protein n=1 Tax=Pseudomonas abietaniphila TaxID=89065 RepID=A0A1G8RAT5_9PSED|nr:hypothetical protein [Pseudomonas abietaniphila]SDJ14086.1 hypothetical protein SAMN05216605_12215 [Pseudomonas abietaniphila]
MNIFKHAARACRSVSRALLVAPRVVLHAKPFVTPAIERVLETVARVLCVESHGVMVCGTSAASVAHFTNPHFSHQSTVLNKPAVL